MNNLILQIAVFLCLLSLIFIYKCRFLISKKCNYMVTCLWSNFVLILSCVFYLNINPWIFGFNFLIDCVMLFYYIYHMLKSNKLDYFVKSVFTTKRNIFVYFLIILICVLSSIIVYYKGFLLFSVIRKFIKVLYISFVFEISVTTIWVHGNINKKGSFNWVLTCFSSIIFSYPIMYISLDSYESSVRFIYILTFCFLYVLNCLLMKKNKNNLLYIILLHVIHDCVYACLF